MSGDRSVISDQNGLYFVTFTVVNWIDVFTRDVYKLCIVDSLNYCIDNKGLTVYSWCLMSNHLHLIIQAKDGFKLSEIIRDFKKFTAKKIIKKMETGPESRRSWMLKQFESAGRKLNRISKYSFGKMTIMPSN